MAKATLSVKKPTSTLTAVQGNVFVASFQFVGEEQAYSRLILAKTKRTLPGMAFTGKVEVPEGFNQGKWCYSQMVISKTTVKYKSGGNVVTSVLNTDPEGKGEKVCDKSFPYDEKTFGNRSSRRMLASFPTKGGCRGEAVWLSGEECKTGCSK
jgi:hypothetical protein